MSPQPRADQPARGVAIIIPARYASTRLPAKALADIAGKPMIQHVWERASRAKCAAAVIVATDDDRIRRAVEAFGGQAVMTSPDCATGTDRVAEVARRLEAEVVVNVQGDEPLLHPDMIDQVAAPLLEDPDLEMATLATPIRAEEEYQDPAAVKVVFDHNGYALYFSRSPIPHLRESGQRPAPAYLHLGLYAFRRDFLLRYPELPRTPLELTENLEQLRALEHGHRIKVVITPHRSLGVDTPEDLQRARAALSLGGSRNPLGRSLPPARAQERKPVGRELAPAKERPRIYRRLPRVDLPGHSYYLGCCLEGRRALLADPVLAQLLLDLYVSLRDAGAISLHGYVVMPDHYHVLLTLHGKASISAVVRSVHSLFARAYRKAAPVRGPIWQRRFYDHVIRDEEDWRTKLSYLHENPVRAGLIENAADYHWSSCAFWETGEGPIECDAWEG